MTGLELHIPEILSNTALGVYGLQPVVRCPLQEVRFSSCPGAPDYILNPRHFRSKETGSWMPSEKNGVPLTGHCIIQTPIN